MALSINDLGSVRKELFDASPKWYDVGLELKVSVTELDNIGDQFRNNRDRLREALKVWLKTATEPTWQDLVKVLKSPVVGESNLAIKIEAEHNTTAEESGRAAAGGQTIPEEKQPQLSTERLTSRQELQQAPQQVEEIQHATEERGRQVRELTEPLQSMKRPGPLPEKRAMQQKAIQNPRSQEISKPEEAMCRGSAATDSNIAYFNSCDSTKVHNYNFDTNEWYRLPDAPYTNFTLVVVQHMLTMVGGKEITMVGRKQIPGAATDSLLSLMGDKEWLPNLPAMPTKRYFIAAVCSGHSLIVAGGYDDHNELATVEVLDTDTRQWSIASSLSHPFSQATISICGERLYMLGGSDQTDRWTHSVLSCSIRELLQSCQPQLAPVEQSTIWKSIADAPHYKASCATLCEQLVAVGGCEADESNTTAITCYDEKINSWESMRDMQKARHLVLVAILNGKMMVVGGKVKGLFSAWKKTNVVEILC